MMICSVAFWTRGKRGVLSVRQAARDMMASTALASQWTPHGASQERRRCGCYALHPASRPAPRTASLLDIFARLAGWGLDREIAMQVTSLLVH